MSVIESFDAYIRKICVPDDKDIKKYIEENRAMMLELRSEDECMRHFENFVKELNYLIKSRTGKK